MENKKVALVVVAAMVMVLISTFTPLALAADEAGRSDGGNGDASAVESISRSNDGKGVSVVADRVNWVSSNRKALRSRLILPLGYIPESGNVCSVTGEFCDGIETVCCKGCICIWQGLRTFCIGGC